jgi:hypothetical protein
MQRSFDLHFAGDDNVELVEVCFSDPRCGIQRRSVRGKTAGAFKDVGSFQWTAAVKALAILTLKAGLAQMARPGEVEHHLAGYKASLAASLDYALSKQPQWLTELFGIDSSGTSILRRLILRTNPERKRPGPVVLSFSDRALESIQFRFTLNGSKLELPEAIQSLLSHLEGGFKLFQDGEKLAAYPKALAA